MTMIERRRPFPIAISFSQYGPISGEELGISLIWSLLIANGVVLVGCLVNRWVDAPSLIHFGPGAGWVSLVLMLTIKSTNARR
jgi:hypothetical protein